MNLCRFPLKTAQSKNVYQKVKTRTFSLQLVKNVRVLLKLKKDKEKRRNLHS